jgi:hypothetical protein
MTAQKQGAAEAESAFTRRRNRMVLAQARASGLIGPVKDVRLSGRVSASLVEAAKTRTGVRSDSELLELALSRLALEDDFGRKLLNRKGSIAPDIDLEL